MKETLTNSQFCHRFKEIRPDNFSWAGLEALFDHLEQHEEDCGEEIEFDPIALCCDYSEHENAADCVREMGYSVFFEGEDEGERENEALEYLQENTQVIEFTGGIIIQGF